MKKKLNLSIIILGISLLSSTAQIYPVRPQLSDKHSFSMILLPDPQSYNKSMLTNRYSSYRQLGLPTASNL